MLFFVHVSARRKSAEPWKLPRSVGFSGPQCGGWSAPLPRSRQALLCAACALGLILAVGLSAALSQCAAFGAQCAQLRSDTLRLHVQADSDSVFDQSVKLRVRDAVLALADRLYADAPDKASAERIAARSLVRFELAARHVLAQLHVRADVHVRLTSMYFSTTRYPGFTLPAGRYDALRVELGARRGRNWWCVLYPGLCLSACAGGYEKPAENALIAGDYEVRFRAVEWWQSLTASRADSTLCGERGV